MRRVLIAIFVVAVAVIQGPVPGLFAAQAKPRSQPDPPRAEEPRRPSDERPAARQEPREGPRETPAEAPEGRQAKPREPAAAPERQGGPRRVVPPPRAVPPPQYYRAPRVYYFPPVSLQRGFYYHPYFGFYYGPYYGPYYPHPGPVFVQQSRYSASAIRTRVRPVEAEVWVNGYFAGIADDFDGVFQRLYLPAGEHVIEFHLDGYRNVRQKLYLQPGDTRDVVVQLLRIGPGDIHETPLTPRALPDEWTTRSEMPVGDRPASPFGVLALTVEPADAQIVIDGEIWLGTAERTELVIHVPSGWHDLEVRKDGYQTFRTRMELSEGGTMRLGVRLVR